MDIYQDIARCHVVSATLNERDWLQRYLTLDPPKRSAYKTYPIRLYRGANVHFGTGLLISIQTAAREAGIVINITDGRIDPPPLDPTADTSWLYDYQERALHISLERKTGLLWLPTGSGKTEIAIALANSVKGEWLFLVHRATLADQAAERYKQRTGKTAGRVRGGTWTGLRKSERFTVATFQSLWRHRNKPIVRDMLSQIRGIIVDEAHTAAAKTYHELIMQTVKANYRIGLSGTPLNRTDNKSAFVVSALGPPIFKLEAGELIDKGVIAKPNITMVKIHQPPAERPTVYNTVYESHVVKSAIRNGAIVNMLRQAPKPALVFVRKLNHGRKLAAMISASGMECDLVTGKDFTESRERKIKNLKKGKTDVLVCTVVFQEGVDIPDLRTVVIASGGSSVIAALQRIGRGMRVSDNKSSCIVIDVHDTGEYFLENQSKKRKKDKIENEI